MKEECEGCYSFNGTGCSNTHCVFYNPLPYDYEEESLSFEELRKEELFFGKIREEIISFFSPLDELELKEEIQEARRKAREEMAEERFQNKISLPKRGSMKREGLVFKFPKNFEIEF